MTQRIQFKKIDPTVDAKREEARAASANGRKYSLFKDGIMSFPFKEGKFFFRLLPQPADAENSWFLTLPYVYMDPSVTPAHMGYFPMTQKQEAILGEIRSTLYRTPQFASRMRSRENPNGVDLGVKYRTVFLGFLFNDSDPKVQPVVMPSNGYGVNMPQGRLQAGTAVTRFMFESDYSGKPKYGNIVDIDSGRLICVEVKGNNDRREYITTVDAPAPLTDARYDHLLNQVRKFEDIIDYHPDEDFLNIIQLRLPEEMFNFVAPRLANHFHSFHAPVVAAAAPAAAAPAAEQKHAEAPNLMAAVPAAGSDVIPIHERYGFKTMEEFSKKLYEDPDFLTKTKPIVVAPPAA